LTGRRAVVTGAASGIGRAVATALGEAGALVLAVDRDEAGLASLDADRTLACDLTVPAERSRLVEEAGAVDYLVNAAGVIRLCRLDDVTEDDWDWMFAVNAKAMFFLTRELLPRMAAGSAVVNISSSAGKTASTVEAAVYNATKASVIAMTKTFAHAYARHGVRVNCVCPAITDTPMLETVTTQIAAARGIEPDAVEAAYHTAIPLGRTARPAEIAGVIAFLLSDKAAYMTGQAVNVTGGLVMY
jgi:NAD(P)-dependent dehydrogenase (short-subunit alcohol dehydrogenase family)